MRGLAVQVIAVLKFGSLSLTQGEISMCKNIATGTPPPQSLMTVPLPRELKIQDSAVTAITTIFTRNHSL